MEAKNKIIIATTYIVFILFLVGIGSGNVISPFFGDINLIDEGQYGAWVRHMLHGELLYKDTYAAYGPLLIYPLYLLSKFFGPSFFLIRLLYGVVGTFFALVISRHILQSLKIPLWLQIATCFLLAAIPSFGLRQGIGLFAIYLLYLSQEKRSLYWNIAAGAVISIAFLVSSEIGIFTFIVASFSFIASIIVSKKVGHELVRLGYVMISAITIFLIFFLWSSYEGWFWPYITTIIDDLTTYSGIELPIGKALPNIFSLLDPFPLQTWLKRVVSKDMLTYWVFGSYIMFFILSFITFISKNNKKENKLLFYVILYGFFLSIILIGRSGHLPFVLAPMFIVLSYYVHVLVKQYTSRIQGVSKLLVTIIILAITLFSLRIILIYRPHFAKAPHAIGAVLLQREAVNYIGPVAISGEQQKYIMDMQKFVSANTAASDNVFFFTNEPGMYLLVNRGNPSKFDLPEVANNKEKRILMVKAIERDKTKYIFEKINDWPIDGVNNRTRLPELYEYIQKNYSPSRVGSYIVYRRSEY